MAWHQAEPVRLLSHELLLNCAKSGVSNGEKLSSVDGSSESVAVVES